MKFTYGILWYFFIVYATSVVVNFSHYHKTFLDDTNESVILSAVKCLVYGTGETNAIKDSSSCKLSFQYKKEVVLYFLKNLLNKKEFNKFFKLTLKNGSKKGESDLMNITLDLKPLFSETNTSKSTQLSNWYTFYVFISILLITIITPLWPLTNYIYIITLISMIMFSMTIYLQLIKLIVFSFVYLITLKKYKFWLLPNLSKDVGLLSTFWPLYELNATLIAQQTDDRSDDKLEHERNVNKKTDTKLEKINQNQINTESTGENQYSTNEQAKYNKSDDDTSLVNLLVNNSPLSSNSIHTSISKQSSNEFTEFVGNDHLPTITTTPPPKFSIEQAYRRPRFELVDLDNEQEVDKEDKIDRKVNVVEGRQRSESDYDFASITPAVSYLNVNEARQGQNTTIRKRIASNRSDDGFEILNNDFLRNNLPSKEDELFVCSKQKL